MIFSPEQAESPQENGVDDLPRVKALRRLMEHSAATLAEAKKNAEAIAAEYASVLNAAWEAKLPTMDLDTPRDFATLLDLVEYGPNDELSDIAVAHFLLWIRAKHPLLLDIYSTDQFSGNVFALNMKAPANLPDSEILQVAEIVSKIFATCSEVRGAEVLCIIRAFDGSGKAGATAWYSPHLQAIVDSRSHSPVSHLRGAAGIAEWLTGLIR